MSLRDKILQAPDLKSESMDIEAWGVTIEVRSMNGTQRARIMKESFDAQTNEVRWDYASLVIAGTYDPETNELIFTELDRDELNTKHGGILEEIAMSVLRLSGLSDDSLSESEKNF